MKIWVCAQLRTMGAPETKPDDFTKWLYILHLFSFIPVIHFEVLRILVLWMEMDTDSHGRVSAHQGKQLDIFAREGQILPGGRILLFSHGICKISKSYQNVDLLLSC